jgi:Flp pilus assembly pilin Flp
MIKFMEGFLQDESGVTSVEYALLAAAAAGVFTVAGSSFYTKISDALEGINLGASSSS